MVVFAKKNILFRDKDASFSLRKDDITVVPDWVAKSPYFAALVEDGKIVVSEGTKTLEKKVEASETSGDVPQEPKKTSRSKKK